MADAGIGKLTVVGKLDPWKLRDHVEAKSHKKVDLISPTNFPKNADKARKPSVAKQSDEKKNQEKHDGDAENSIALRRMHPSNPQDHPQDQRKSFGDRGGGCGTFVHLFQELLSEHTYSKDLVSVK